MRRQYLFVDGRTVLAFVKNGEKFAQCANYTDITADVKCKVICCREKCNCFPGDGGCRECRISLNLFYLFDKYNTNTNTRR